VGSLNVISDCPNTPVPVLIIEDERPTAELLARILRAEGFDVSISLSANQARQSLKDRFFPVVLCDINLGSASGLELVSSLDERNGKPIVIFITGYADVDTAAEALRLGAFEYLSKSDRF
jgi:two-component system response regulator HydG